MSSSRRIFFFIEQKDKKTGALKIWIYKDKTTGEGKGEATVTYEDEQAAQAAIGWFNGTTTRMVFSFTATKISVLFCLDKEVLSNVVKVSLATRRASAFGGRGGFRGGRGGSRGRGSNFFFSFSTPNIFVFLQAVVVISVVIVVAVEIGAVIIVVVVVVQVMVPAETIVQIPISL